MEEREGILLLLNKIVDYLTHLSDEVTSIDDMKCENNMDNRILLRDIHKIRVNMNDDVKN